MPLRTAYTSCVEIPNFLIDYICTPDKFNKSRVLFSTASVQIEFIYLTK